MTEKLRLWVDGNTVHCALRCFDGTGRSGDTHSLLHLCSLIAFADELLVGDFAGGAYSKRTDDSKFVLNKLTAYNEIDRRRRKYDLWDKLINPFRMTLEMNESIYETAAVRLANDLSGVIAASARGTDYQVLTSNEQSLEARFYEFILADRADIVRKQTLDDIRGQENNGLLLMVCSSEKLWRAIRSMVELTPNWGAAETKKLADAMRSFVHVEAARRANAFYAPGLDRAQTIAGYSLGGFPHVLWDDVQNLPQAINAGQSQVKSDLPPVATFLTYMCAGKPQAMLELALQLRLQTIALRLKLNQMLTYDTDSNGPPLGVHREWNELVESLNEYLKKAPIKSFSAAAFQGVDMGSVVRALIDGTAVGGIANIGGAMRGIRRLGDYPTIMILGDIANFLRWTKTDKMKFKELESNILAQGQ